MKYIKNNGDDGGVEPGAEDEPFFIEDYRSSEGEEVAEIIAQKYHSNCQQVARLHSTSSPPLALAFSARAGPVLQDSSSSPASSPLSQQGETDQDGDHTIEEWMILGGEESQVGDSNIQLNLCYWTPSENESEDEDPNVKSIKNTWAVSVKDKRGSNLCPSNRYFEPDRSLVCQMCNRTGHFAKRCFYYKKSFTCIFCGIQGHNKRDCPGLPCRRCGLPSHGSKPCEKPPVWNQHCHRCGITGHLSYACPDIWRQYHLTIQSEVPLRPQTVCTHKQKRYKAHCYNCSKMGHYGYECTKKRMVMGTFPSLPYVCYYDTMEDISKCHTKMQKRAIGDNEALPPSDQHYSSEPKEENGEESHSVQGRSRKKQEACSQTARRKKWPERRKERREVKRLRREAQAMRGGLSGKSQCNLDDDACPADLLNYSLQSHRSSTPPQQEKRMEKANRRSSRKSKEAERWKKRGGMKRGDLYPHTDLDIGSENLLSPKQRVRHRRR